MPGMLPERPLLKLPEGGCRNAVGGLWKERLGLVLRLRLFDTVRASLSTLPAMSCAGVMVRVWVVAAVVRMWDATT